jgi:hypothetical protein
VIAFGTLYAISLDSQTLRATLCELAKVASSSYILPSAKALGIWGRVTQFFNVAWLFFDMGTSAAFVKFLAEYRVHDPRRGI